MCWIGNLTDKKIASEAVTVYKILAWDGLNRKYVAPYQRTEYKIGKMYTISSLIPTKHCFGEYYLINEGFHTFNKDCLVRYGSCRDAIIYGQNGVERMIIGGSLTDLAVIAKCTIPKGATYYENSRGVIVSDSLIVNEVYEDLPYEMKHFHEII